MNAMRITGYTLVGVGPGERPQDSGNCFSVEGDDGKRYGIVNFNLENMEALNALGLKWPVACKVLKGHIAIIHEPRIGERWYEKRYCTVCCPEDLLPITQLQEIERDEMRGRRRRNGDFIHYNLTVALEFP